jgi:hypothetical protein
MLSAVHSHQGLREPEGTGGPATPQNMGKGPWHSRGLVPLCFFSLRLRCLFDKVHGHAWQDSCRRLLHLDWDVLRMA